MAAAKNGTEVTYQPGFGDPMTVKWRGYNLTAGKPVVITNADDLEAAKKNKFFAVDGHDNTEENPNAGPMSSMDYRRRWVGEMDRFQTVEELIKAFAGERQMREAAGVGQDDIKWLGTMIEPRIKDMRGREGLNDRQVSDLWLKYGIPDQPWRA